MTEVQSLTVIKDTGRRKGSPAVPCTLTDFCLSKSGIWACLIEATEEPKNVQREEGKPIMPLLKTGRSLHSQQALPYDRLVNVTTIAQIFFKFGKKVLFPFEICFERSLAGLLRLIVLL